MPKNTTRKNTKQTKQVAEKPKADTANDDDWGFGNLIVKTNPNSTRSKKKTPEPKPEPIPEPKPEWEQVGMTEEEYRALQERMAKQMLEWQMETYRNNLIAELDSVAYWESRIESLEMSRQRYNKKRGWSGEDVAAVEEIDKEIQECENEISRIDGYEEFEEVAAY